MATIADLPHELLYHIIFLLVQSAVGAADLARIMSVCRTFLSYADDVSIPKLVSFDSEMECKKFYNYQHINGLLVKCSEAGNMDACLLLGKVILLSSSQLFLIELHIENFDVSTRDRAKLWWSLATYVPAENSKDYFYFYSDSENSKVFMTYFLPKQVSTSESSQTRLVHYQLVKLFLLDGSHNDIIEMGVFLKSYIKYFTGVSRKDSRLITDIKVLVSLARRVRSMRILDLKAEEYSLCCNDPSITPSEKDHVIACLSQVYNSICDEANINYNDQVGVDPMPIINGIEAIYNDFAEWQEQTARSFELKFE